MSIGVTAVTLNSFTKKRKIETGTLNMTKKFSRAICSLIAACFVLSTLAVTPAWAVETMFVTATKRAKSSQDVSISLTVFDRQEIARLGANDLRDLDGFIPNVIQTGLDSNVSGGVSIRGITSDDRNIGFNSGASMYVDGVFVGRSFAFLSDMLDVERFEVLRGPQGTLFGKNTIAGAFNITTLTPGDEVEGQLEFQAGNFDTYRVRGRVAGPIVEGVVSASVSGFLNRRDGFQTNVVGGASTAFDGLDFWNEKSQGGRAKIRVTPTDNIDIVLAGDIFDADERMNRDTPFIGLGATCCGGDPRLINIDAPNFVDREYYGVSLTGDLELANGGVITSITAYRDNKRSFLSDDDTTDFPIIATQFDDMEQQFTQELRYTSPDEGPFTYVVGAYYYDQKAVTDVETNTGVCAFCFAPFPLQATIDSEINTRSFAFFGHMEWEVTSSFSLIGGLRYTNEKRDLDAWNLVGIFGLVGSSDLSNITRPSIKDDALSWEAGVAYQAMESTRLYAKAARGFKSGGFNVDFLADEFPNPPLGEIDFNPEFALTYEGGVKFLGLDDRLRANLAGFFTDYKDLQVSSFNMNSVGFTIQNAATAEIYGFELDLVAEPLEGLTIATGVGYQHATFKSFDKGTADPSDDFDGNFFEGAPKWNFNIAATYTHDLGDWGSAYLRGEYTYRANYFDDPNNDPLQLIDGYGLGNARLGFNSEDEHWTLELFVKNITNKLYLNGVSDPVGGLLGQTSQVFGPPRTFGARVVGRL